MKKLTYKILLRKEPEGGYTVIVPTLTVGKRKMLSWLLKINMVLLVKINKFPYQEWWRDWPCEARQPTWYKISCNGAKSCRGILGDKERKNL